MNRKKFWTPSTRGFSIVAVLVASAMLGILAVAFSQFLDSASKGQKNLQNAVDFDLLKTNLNLILNTKACDGAFQLPGGAPVQLALPAGQTWSTLTTTPVSNVIVAGSPLKIAQIRQNNSTIAEINQSLGGGMTLTKLEFVEATYDGEQSLVVDPTTVPPTKITYKAFLAQLHIEVKKQSGSFGAPFHKANLGVRLLVNPTASTTQGAVERCGSTQPLLPSAAIYTNHCGWAEAWPSIIGNCNPASCAAGDQLLDKSCYVDNVWDGSWTIGLCTNTCMRQASGVPDLFISYKSRCGWAKNMGSQSGFSNSPGDCSPPACGSGTSLASKSCFATVPWWGAGWWAIGHCENNCILQN